MHSVFPVPSSLARFITLRTHIWYFSCNHRPLRRASIIFRVEALNSDTAFGRKWHYCVNVYPHASQAVSFKHQCSLNLFVIKEFVQIFPF